VAIGGNAGDHVSRRSSRRAPSCSTPSPPTTRASSAALGEAKEAHTALRYAVACSYADVDDALLRRVDGVAAVLYRLAQRRR
jgi:hypothetical protein